MKELICKKKKSMKYIKFITIKKNYLDNFVCVKKNRNGLRRSSVTIGYPDIYQLSLTLYIPHQFSNRCYLIFINVALIPLYHYFLDLIKT